MKCCLVMLSRWLVLLALVFIASDLTAQAAPAPVLGAVPGQNINMVSGKNMNGVSSKETALQLAGRAKRSDIVALLLRYGAQQKPSLIARVKKSIRW